jgi:periplasmic protein TonB
MKEKLIPNHEIKRRPQSNLRNYYVVLLETGLLFALIILVILFRIKITITQPEIIKVVEHEEIEIEEIVQTEQREMLPPPPRPPVPVSVPNHAIIEDVDIIIDAELRFDSFLTVPDAPPPPPPKEEEFEEPEEGFFVVVEQMPVLIGGLAAMQNEVRYPEMALRANIQGRVVVQFIVNERGDVENPRVIRGIGGGCDEEAIRVVSKMKFVPGMQRGRPVRVQYHLPVVFIIRT